MEDPGTELMATHGIYYEAANEAHHRTERSPNHIHKSIL
jgi:hypothetical protein